jgi:putative acetyltransferase
MHIRQEDRADRAAVHAVNRAAFGTSAEADLVDLLRPKAGKLVSLVAEVDDTVVGHVLFSPVSLSAHDNLNIMGLGPMAVAPDHQRKGIGSALVREGLEQCKQLAC